MKIFMTSGSTYVTATRYLTVLMCWIAAALFLSACGNKEFQDSAEATPERVA